MARARWSMWPLLTVTVLISRASPASDSVELAYMPEGSFSTRAEADERERKFATSILMMLGEGNLREGPSRAVDSYRCLVVPSFDRTTMVRLDRRSGTTKITLKQLATGAVAPTEPMSRDLQAGEVARIGPALQDLRLDGLARPDGSPPGYTDTNLLVFESVVGGRYHVRFEESPNERGSGQDLREACVRMLCLTGRFDESSSLMRELGAGASPCTKR